MTVLGFDNVRIRVRFIRQMAVNTLLLQACAVLRCIARNVGVDSWIVPLHRLLAGFAWSALIHSHGTCTRTAMDGPHRPYGENLKPVECVSRCYRNGRYATRLGCTNGFYNFRLLNWDDPNFTSSWRPALCSSCVWIFANECYWFENSLTASWRVDEVHYMSSPTHDEGVSSGRGFCLPLRYE